MQITSPSKTMSFPFTVIKMDFGSVEIFFQLYLHHVKYISVKSNSTPCKHTVQYIYVYTFSRISTLAFQFATLLIIKITIFSNIKSIREITVRF